MTFTSILSITPSPFLSVMICIVLLLAVLYFARRPFHRSVRSFSRIIQNAMRLTAHSVLQAEKKLSQRNREVLIAAGLENAERVVEREFERISTGVLRDLESYPNLQRQLSETTTRLDEDYVKSTDVPPALPNWTPIIKSIANVEHTGDSLVANMLGQINQTLEEQHKTAVGEYRNSIASRHKLLNKMLSAWRQVQRSLDDIEKSITQLVDRSKSIDRYMDEYKDIHQQTDEAARMLSSSSMTQFFIAGLVLLIAIGGAIINFNLIALPMSEMVGGASYIGPYKTSDVAGLVIILIELTMGLFLLESLRITRLFSIIGNMDDKMRHRMFLITLTMLTILAGVESSLAFMRDRIAGDMEALRQTLSGVEQEGVAASMIPMIGQMVMGFILPFALAFVAIPLESFISSSRTVLGVLAAGFLRAMAFVLRLLGNLVYYGGRFISNMYDLFIFPTIWLEGVILGVKTRQKGAPDREIQETNSFGSRTHNLDELVEVKEPHE
jgi:hypothetical protein